MAKRSCDPRVAFREVKVQVRDLVRVVGIRFIEPQGINGHRRSVHPAARGTPVYTRGVSIPGRFVLSRNPGYKTRGVAMWLNVVLRPPGSLPRSKRSDTGPSVSY